MSGATLLFLIVGPVAMLVGIAMLIAAIRGRPGETPKSTILLIAGMTATAFGMLLAVFAVSNATSAWREPPFGALSSVEQGIVLFSYTMIIAAGIWAALRLGAIRRTDGWHYFAIKPVAISAAALGAVTTIFFIVSTLVALGVLTPASD